MKTKNLLAPAVILACALSLTACGPDKEQPSTSATPQKQSDAKSKPESAAKSSTEPGGNPITAPVDYLGAVAQGQKKAVGTLEIAGLKQAIQMFQVNEGRFPKTLQELVKPDYLSKLPIPPHGMRFDYDPNSGQVKLVRAP